MSDLLQPYVRGRYDDFWRIYCPFTVLQVFTLAGLHPTAANIHNMNATMLLTGPMALCGAVLLPGSRGMSWSDRLKPLLMFVMFGLEFVAAWMLKLGIAEYEFPIPLPVMFVMFILSGGWVIQKVVDRCGGNRTSYEKNLMAGFFTLLVGAMSVDAYLVSIGVVSQAWRDIGIILSAWLLAGWVIPLVAMWIGWRRGKMSYRWRF